MAELNTGDGGKKDGGKVRSKKSSAGVDLTAMVDLAFLLITFFILTTTLSKPQSMNLALPDKDPVKQDERPEAPAFRTLQLVLGTKDQLVTYVGQKPDGVLGAPVETGYGKEGVRGIILKKIEELKSQTKDGIIVIIKPSKKSNYKNLVDILDEMAITKVQKYAIMDITDEDVKLLDEKGLN